MLRVTKIGQLRVGDEIVIIGKNDSNSVKTKVLKVINPNTDEEEILFHRAKNLYFIMSMYLDGKSWAEKVYII